MFPAEWPRDRGVDIALLGTLVAGLGAYAGVFPQDKALLLLTDAASGGVETVGGVGLSLIAIGVVLMVTGALAARSEW